MKKYTALYLSIIIMSSLIGCGDGSSSTVSQKVNQTPGVSDVLEAQMAEADKDKSDNATESSRDASESSQTATANSKDASESSQTATANSKDANESSQTATANSKDTSESSQTATANSKDTNEGSQTATANSKDTNEGSQTATANSKDANESSGQNAPGQLGLPEDAPVPEEEADSQISTKGSEGIDIDLTTLSSTMVYSEVYNIMISPQEYVGKTIKMKGELSFFPGGDSGKNYFTCIIKDATACCAQGIEFELTDDYVYPDDYPEDGEEITVAGTFDLYQDGGYTYGTLRNAVLF
ncbi:MAG: hypothetical protein K5989_06360 [Lachnospiraceae bacterium]|nr:hypothetical protein [Lachnospiraceae bacterium]